MSLFSILDDAAENWPEVIAVVDHRQRLSYRQLQLAGDALAGALRCAGVQAGDKVAILFPRGAEEIVASFAVLKLGGIVVQISPALKAAEIDKLSVNLNIDAFLFTADYDALIPRSRNRTAGISIIEKPFPVRVQRAQRRSEPAAEREQLREVNAAAIGFTSGTTSESKAIIFSHEALLARARIESSVFSISAGDSVLYLLSISYCCAPPIAGALLSGATLLLADSAFIRWFPRLVAEYGVDVVYASPIVYRMILNEPGKIVECFRSARRLVTTGSRLPEGTADEFRLRVGHEIVNRYGLNECGMVFANLSGDERKRGSVGLPAGAEVKIAEETGAPSAEEIAGELLVRTPGLFEAYGSPWRPRDDVLEESWFKTGDLFKRDTDGYYWIIGRLKDMINVGGLKVIPSEVEDVLVSHPDIEEALVFGVSDPRFGEVPHAKVKPLTGLHPQATDILRYVNERLAFYKSPRSVEFVEQLPKTATGKIKRQPRGFPGQPASRSSHRQR